MNPPNLFTWRHAGSRDHSLVCALVPSLRAQLSRSDCTPLLLEHPKGGRFRSRWKSPRLRLTSTPPRRLPA
jgi:hypothetical protein